MFAFSLKKFRVKVSFFMITAAAVLTAALVLGSSPAVYTSATSDVVREFLTSEGILVETESAEHTVYTVPGEFDKVMQGYNELQLKQGFDLTKYKNKTVEKYTYTVLNYPGYEDSDSVKANIFVYCGEIIAGDICCVKLNGFMEGIKKSDGKDKIG